MRGTGHPNRGDIIRAVARSPSPYARKQSPGRMADQTQQAAKGAAEKTQNAGGVQNGIEGATSGMLSTAEGWGNRVAGKGKEVLDRIISPEQRANILAKLQDFMLRNPKLSVSPAPHSDLAQSHY